MGFDFVSLFGMKEGSVNNRAGKRRELLEGRQQQQGLEKGEWNNPTGPSHSRLECPRLGHVVPWVLATLEQ